MPMPPPRPSLADRRAAGKALRDQLHRTDQGTWAPPGDRPDLIPLLETANATRRPELLPIKWGRMSASPFAFFRGTAALMAADLGPGPVTGMTVQMCGDAHLLNLGAYAAPDGHLVFAGNGPTGSTWSSRSVSRWPWCRWGRNSFTSIAREACLNPCHPGTRITFR